jgi:hypothetical protein
MYTAINFDDLVAHKRLTPDGMTWLKVATDPFHDTPVRPQGFPDMQVGESVVEKQALSLTLQTPNASSAFDALIFLSPASTAMPMLDIVSEAGQQVTVQSAASTNRDLNMLTCLTQVSGTGVNLFPFGSATPGIAEVDGLSPAYGPKRGTRVIGLGFEVINETPELYTGGDVTVGFLPMEIGSRFITTRDTSAVLPTIDSTARISLAPPGSKAQATMVPNSKTWKAKQGCYVPARLMTEDDPVLSAVVPGALTYPGAMISRWTHTGFNCENWSGGFPWACSYAFFAGLPAETKLTVRLHVYLEIFPGYPGLGSGDPLLPLASPSARDDPTARKLYGQIMARMPSGVPQNMNPGGEYFRLVLSGLGAALKAGAVGLSFVDPVLGLGAEALGAAVSAAGPVVGGLVGYGQPKKKKPSRIPQPQYKPLSVKQEGKAASAARRAAKRK